MSARKRKGPPVVEPICMECGKLGQLTPGSVVYPHRPDLHAKRFYVCECGAKVGCHDGTTIPLGYPAGPDTQRARDKAHREFDPIWRAKEETGMRRSQARTRAYAWLAAELGIDPAGCHISHFDRATCERVVEICKPVRDGIARVRRAHDQAAPIS